MKEVIDFYKAVYDAQFQTQVVQEQLTQLQKDIDIYVNKQEERENKHLKELNKLITLIKEAVNALALIGGAVKDEERSDEHKIIYVTKVIDEFMALLERWKD